MTTRYWPPVFLASLVLYINAVHNGWALFGAVIVVVMAYSFAKVLSGRGR